jgi:hypothetical protein
MPMNEKDVFIKKMIFKNDGTLDEKLISDKEFDELDEKVFYNIMVSREDIERGNIQYTLKQFERIEKKKSKARTSSVILFDGYNDDPREIYEIPEIRSWIRRFLKQKPYFFYFISPVDTSYMKMWLFCLCDVKREGNDITLKSAKNLVEKITQDAVSYSKKLKDSIEVQYSLANLIMEKLDYDKHCNYENIIIKRKPITIDFKYLV